MGVRRATYIGDYDEKVVWPKPMPNEYPRIQTSSHAQGSNGQKDGTCDPKLRSSPGWIDSIGSRPAQKNFERDRNHNCPVVITNPKLMGIKKEVQGRDEGEMGIDQCDVKKVRRRDCSALSAT
jgi:hypothetical protein